MIVNYIKIAFRSLLHNKTYSAINIGGLALGIATCLLLMLWATDELSYDRFHTTADRIYKMNASFENNGERVTWNSPGPLAVFAKQQVPAVQEAIRVMPEGENPLYTSPDNDKRFQNCAVAFVDEAFFKMFDFQLIKGNAQKPFPDLQSVIVSESMAKKFFGDGEALNKTLIRDGEFEFKICGIMEDMPHNSSLRYDILLPFALVIEYYAPNASWKTLETDWGNFYIDTYLLLEPAASPEAVAQQLTAIHKEHHNTDDISYIAQPLTKLHLYSAGLQEEGIQTVRIFLIVAVAILLIACINYVNLATARATTRAREVGIRKTTGAGRAKLIWQFLTESVILSLIAVSLAAVLIQITTPLFNELSGKTLSFDLLNWENLLLTAGVLLITCLVAGVYPAWVLSSFRPIHVIRGKLTVSGGNAIFRKALVVTQFVLSIGIIAGALVVQKQLNFIHHKALGFDKENVFTFPLRRDAYKSAQEYLTALETIKDELVNHGGIEKVTYGSGNILALDMMTGDTDWQGKLPDQGMRIQVLSADKDFRDALDVEIVKGSYFSGAKATDSVSFILNETAIRQMGIEDPVGKSFTLFRTRGTIVGVVKDFHHRSMRRAIEPAVFECNPYRYGLVYVKVNGRDTPGAIAAAENTWTRYNPEYPFEYNFLDQAFDSMYKTEQRMGKLFIAFSTVAIVVSCLGLLGLATFTASQRTKEIGIRKVLGASLRQIMMLLSKDFVRLVLIAFALSIPVAYFSMQRWLQDFAYHVSIDWTVFALAGALALLIAFITMSLQTVKAGLNNPVDALRNE